MIIIIHCANFALGWIWTLDDRFTNSLYSTLVVVDRVRRKYIFDLRDFLIWEDCLLLSSLLPINVIQCRQLNGFLFFVVAFVGIHTICYFFDGLT